MILGHMGWLECLARLACAVQCSLVLHCTKVQRYKDTALHYIIVEYSLAGPGARCCPGPAIPHMIRGEQGEMGEIYSVYTF